jgi:radical SAM protein with 4Fe4S-binding SPASM domain
MPQLQEVKKQLIAGQANKTFDFFIQWHLTERCNLNCRHCYQKRRKPGEMSNSELKQEIDGVMEMFADWEKEHDIVISPSIHFTGGEPFVYKGLWDIITHARQRGFNVAILTNGSLVKTEDAAKASRLGVMDIQVSLEGPPEIHDAIRGSGSFDAAVKGARLLIEAGNKVLANMTLSGLNIARIEETTDIARKVGFSGMGFSRLVPCGSGKNLLANMLTSSEIRNAYTRAFAFSSSLFKVSSGDPLFGVISGVKPSPQSHLTLSGCSAGFSGITITSDGSVMPCRRIGLKIGNLRKTSLRQIWSSSKLLWRLRQRERYEGKCGKCALWPSCRGCRAVAYAYSKSQGTPNIFADDPQCWMMCPDKSDFFISIQK